MAEHEISALIEDLQTEWTLDSNKATEVRIWHMSANGDGKPAMLSQFNPSFSYHMFGDDELIIGYQKPRIHFHFAAHDMRCTYEFKHSGIMPDIQQITATDVEEGIKPFLSKPSFASCDELFNALESDTKASEFTPPGKKVFSYHVKSEQFEIWQSSLNDKTARSIVGQAQVIMPMFIEGATCIDLDEQDASVLNRWKVFFVYQVLSDGKGEGSPPNVSQYALAGYATSYRLWYFVPRTDSDSAATNGKENAAQDDQEGIKFEEAESQCLAILSKDKTPLGACRERISQFLIFPPHRGRSHGSRLYNVMTDVFRADKSVREIVVEDPNESFDDMRDFCDMAMLRETNPDFASLRINTANIDQKPLKDPELPLPLNQFLDTSITTPIQREAKIHRRQFDRLVEMQTLSHIPTFRRSVNRISRKWNTPNEEDRQYYFWRLMVKARLARHNRDALAELDSTAERVDRIDAALSGVENDYTRLLEGIDARAAKQRKASTHKRKTPMPEDEDAQKHGKGKQVEADPVHLEVRPANKKARVTIVDDDDDN